jgi:TonB family protein
LSSLKVAIASGNQRLDSLLAAIAAAARELTGASGAALAMWKEGEMVCRARSGETAPVLGTRLSAEAGISGECLRTGRTHHCADTENDPLVDVEVCRSLGLRSIVAIPIQGWRGVNGILEVFSTRPGAFREEHLALLEQLAALAERARGSQPHSASSAAPRRVSASDDPKSASLLPASDPVGDVAFAFVGRRMRPFVLAAVGLLAASLIGLVVWLGWRGAEDSEDKNHVAAQRMARTGSAPTSHGNPTAAPENSPDAGNTSASESSGFPNPANGSPAGAPVKLAGEMDLLVGGDMASVGRGGAQTHSRAVRGGGKPLLGDMAQNVGVPSGASGSQAFVHVDSREPYVPNEKPDADSHPANPSAIVQDASDLPLPRPAVAPGENAEGGAPVQPNIASPISQGISGGEIEHRPAPVYPAAARTQHIEGSVVLSAMVKADGTVSDVKLVRGSPILAQSAIDAVKRWRYHPFVLNGNPVSNQIVITIEFKLPLENAAP